LISCAYTYPGFDSAVNYPHIGLMLAPLSHSKPRPLPMPEAHTFIIEGEDELIREDRFEPYQLWYHDQCEGRWQDTAGNTLLIGRITTALPEFPEEFITRERYNQVSADDQWHIDGRTAEQIHAWAATFTGETLFEPETLNINSFALSSVYTYTCQSSNLLVYTFHPRRIGNARNFDWFCVTLKAPGTADIGKLQRNFEETWMSEIAQPTTFNRHDGAQSREISTSRQGIPDFDQPHHPVRLAARKGIANYEQWWCAETDGYTILSDVNTNLGRSLVETVQQNMPVFLAACRKLLPPLTAERDVALIRIFQFKSDYDTYVGEKFRWSSGIWMPRRRELALTQEAHKEKIMSTLRHEAFHQYISYAWGMLTPAPWLNEGHACFFENAHIDSKSGIFFEEDLARCRLLLENPEQAAALIPHLLQMSYGDFYDGGGTRAGRAFNYALAWGLVYYLQKGAPQERNTPFRNILNDYAEALLLTRDYQQATDLTFAEVDMQVFQSNFKEFWLKRRASAMQYDPVNE
jgi:hypothetical protein